MPTGLNKNYIIIVMTFLEVFPPFLLVISISVCVGIFIVCSIVHTIIRRNNIRYEPV